VTPGAARDELAGIEAGFLRVRVRARAHEGKANAALRTVLAEALGLPSSAVQVTRGQTARRKQVMVSGLDEAEARRRLGVE
jgi:uncharacterized protein YggU (UPF0235/DUF167 family)